jgi:hypothetical protein
VLVNMGGWPLESTSQAGNGAEDPDGTPRPFDARPYLERVMNLGENRIEMRIPRLAWSPRHLCFPYS